MLEKLLYFYETKLETFHIILSVLNKTSIPVHIV